MIKRLIAIMTALVSLLLTQVAMAQDNSLIVYYDFENVQGNKIPDESGNGNDAEITGAKVVNEGKYGKGLNFPVQGAYAVAPDSASLDIAKAITLAGWINYPPNANWECIVNKWAWNFSGWSLQTMNANNVHTSMWINGFKAELTGPTIIKDNTWHHIASTYDGTKDGIKLYVDGKLDAQGGDVGKSGYSGDIDVNDYWLGLGVQGGWISSNQVQGGNDWTVGTVDEIVVYNRALSQDEIKNLMSGVSFVVEPKAKLTTTWAGIKSW
jgi:hypothetical protein